MFNRNNFDKKEYYLYNDGKMIFPKIGYATDEYAYSIVNKDILDKSPDLLLNLPNHISELNSINEEDWILLKYKYK